MTQQEFLAIANLYPNQINVWITPDPAPYRVQGVSIPVIDKSQENTSQYLEQVQTVILPVSSTQVLSLKVTARSIQYSGTITYYFLNVEEIPINSITPVTNNNTKVIILPGLDGAIFEKSPYNILQGGVEIQRQSDYITQFGSSVKAYIQDSSYSSTGWINARYEGSSTSILNYKAVEPAIAGNTFKGNYYSITTTDDQINNQNTLERVEKTYLHTGNTQLPEYELRKISLWIAGPQTPTQDFINVKTFTGTFFTGPIPPFTLKVGDLIKIESTNPLEAYVETLKVNKITPQQGNLGEIGTAYRLDVTRGWGRTQLPQQDYVSDNSIRRISPVRVFELQGNKVQGASQGKIRVVETSEIITIDQLGFVITGSAS